MRIYETREQAARENINGAILQVDGGYAVFEWPEAFRRIREEAESLYNRGWRACDMSDIMTAYDFDKEHAESISAELSEIEEEQEETEPES